MVVKNLFNKRNLFVVSPDLTSSKKKRRVVFIVWYYHSRRSESISKELDATLYFIYLPIKIRWLYPIKLIYQIIMTFRILLSEKPSIIFVQNPPLFCPFSVYIFSKLYGARFIVDNHNGAFTGLWKNFIPLTMFIIRRSTISLVHNQAVYESLKKNFNTTGKLYILEDKIPEIDTKVLKENEGVSEKDKKNYILTVISSLDKREHIPTIVKAAKDIPNLKVIITGNISNAPPDTKAIIKDPPKNINFTGFLPDEKYWYLLKNSDIILVFDERDNILCCGGYEAIAVEKPLLIVRNGATTAYYSNHVLFIGDDPEDIRKKIMHAIENSEKLKELSKQLKIKKKIEWEKKFGELKKLIGW